MSYAQFDRLVAWLHAHARESVPMPLRAGTKQPLHRHKSGAWTWSRCRAFVAAHPDHGHWSVLLRDLCALDFDDDALAQEWESRFPELQRAPLQLTQKGRHYLFRRSAYADAAGFFDGARQSPCGAAVDFKTVCSTGTGGVLVVAPSAGKCWAPGRGPWECGVEEIPPALLHAVATPHGGPPPPPVPGESQAEAAAEGGAGAGVAGDASASDSGDDALADSGVRPPSAAVSERGAFPPLTPESAGELLACLKRDDDYSTWLRVAAALLRDGQRDGAPDRLYGAWLRWSQDGAHHSGADDCRRKWDEDIKAMAVQPGGVNVGTLRYWAKADAPVEYAAWCAKHVRAAASASSCTDVVEVPQSARAVLASAGGARPLNRLFELEEHHTWLCSSDRESQLKLMPAECLQCLVKGPGATHAHVGHSCLFVSTGARRSASVCCFTHGKRELKGDPLKQLLEYLQGLGLVRGGGSGAAGRDRDPRDTPFTRSRDVVLSHAEEMRLMKHGGHVWRPIEGCPCAYTQGESFEKFLNKVLRTNVDYNSDNSVHHKLEDHLTYLDPPEFPKLEHDRGLLSFSDGVLVLPEARFVPYTGGPAPPEEFVGRVARHHIPSPYQSRASLDTPLFDRVLAGQMSPAVAHTLHVMLGRLLFPVGALDNWQVMPVLIGAAGTGKSLVLEVAKAMFSVRAVAIINGSAERVFGLEGKVDKEVILGLEMPREMSEVLHPTLLQSMVSGEAMCIPRKGRVALEVPHWSVPMALASNHWPDYLDSAGALARRIIPFFFRQDVKEPDTTLLRRILASELPAIVRKVLHAYMAAVHEHKDRAFFSWCPEELKDARQEMQLQTDYVRRFLAAGPTDNASGTVKIYVTQRQGEWVTMGAFKTSFRKFMHFQHRGVKWDFDESSTRPFTDLGYEVITTNWCKGCNQEARGGSDDQRCCADYGKANRTYQTRIKHMRIVHEAVEAPVAQYDPYE